MSQFSDWERDYGSPYDHAARRREATAAPDGVWGREALRRWLDSLPFAERIEAELCLPCPGGCGQSSLACTCGGAR